MVEATTLPAVAEVSQVVAAYRDIVEVNAARARIAQLMAEGVLKNGVHFGKVTNSDKEKPSLWKAGAEVVCFTFRIANEHVRVDDLSVRDEHGHLIVVRYRIVTRAVHIPTGAVLGEGIGECSSDEEKYAWRKVVCPAEFEAAADHNRRIKFYNNDGQINEVQQIRQNAADVANTVLKMGDKRSYVDMTLKATAASEFYGQDMDDDSIAAAIAAGDAAAGAPPRPTPTPVQRTRERAPASTGGKNAPKSTAPAATASGELGEVVRFCAEVDAVNTETRHAKPKPGEREGRPYTITKITLGAGVGQGLVLTTFDKGVLDAANSAKARGERIEGNAIRGKFGLDVDGNVEIVVGGAEPAAADASAAPAAEGAAAGDGGDGGDLSGI